jgi:hypothetical protein
MFSIDKLTAAPSSTPVSRCSILSPFGEAIKGLPNGAFRRGVYECCLAARHLGFPVVLFFPLPRTRQLT